ncbi:MAG: ArsA family ATPase, partial [Nocardioidaceae bacterium]
LREAAYFVERLSEESMPLAGLVLNRVSVATVPGLSAEAALAAAERLGESEPTARLLRLHAERCEQVEREHAMTRRFTAAHPSVPMVRVPALPTDVHDLAGLREVGALLSPPAAQVG